MTKFDAHQWFATHSGEQWLIERDGEVIDMRPILLTAACSLVGWLEDARTGDDLLDAYDHFVTCLGMEVFTSIQWHDECDVVLDEVRDARAGLMGVMA